MPTCERRQYYIVSEVQTAVGLIYEALNQASRKQRHHEDKVNI